ncbi:hypothetical protein O0I10_007691 [Lichtheimia ornata]|uniref:Uncharacterized protein n=1 Tax=Lichtheimia ornata TaxID=688661 RepID=A0AAD7XTN1_9FUNG|nr:uncharacterized protein O0I10_007691 [Lichtheimia ornata]KAJ8656614.1 hypothetical protein O0I10_007691 [Lichtheimia ornata]
MSKKYKGDYICRVRYRSKLPPLPFPPKFLSLGALGKINATHHDSTIGENPSPLHVEPSYGIVIDQPLVEYLNAANNSSEVARNEYALSEEDRVFLQQPPSEQEPGSQEPATRIWVKPSSLSQTFVEKKSKAKVDSKASNKRRRTLAEAFDVVVDGFNISPDELVHPRTKAKVKNITPLLPDKLCENTIYTIGQFSGDPANERRLGKRKYIDEDEISSTLKEARLSALDATDRGIMRPITNPHDQNDSYLIWFLPDESGTEKLVQQKKDAFNAGVQGLPSDESITYLSAREYLYDHDNQHSQIMVAFRDGVSYYTAVRSKMTVTKKRAVSKELRYLENYEKPNVLNVTFHS